MSRGATGHGVAAVTLAAALAGAAVSSCVPARPKAVDFAEVKREYRPKDYLPVHDAWTRHAKLVRDVGTVIEAWATCKSWEFRQAYVAHYADVYGLSDADRSALLKSQLDTSRAAYEFHVVVQTTSDRWNDLERRTSPWRVSLLDGTGAELSPASIAVVKLPELYELQFFPSRTEFSRGYLISFARPAGTGDGFVGPASGRMILRVASPLGRIDLVWESR